MTKLDRLLQQWRIRRAGQFISRTARVLDIGCADGTLFQILTWLQDGIGIDPDLEADISKENARLISGFFPKNLSNRDRFDTITMLAVLEHIPAAEQIILAKNCFQYLNPRGNLIVTVPSPFVDKILFALKWLRLVDGMKTEQHYGYDVNLTPELFISAGFELTHTTKFQLGLNNLFVFTKPDSIKEAVYGLSN